MESVTVRKARPEDLATLLRFQQGVVSAERGFDSTLKPGDIEYHDVARMLAAGNVHFVIAEAAGEAIGCGFARIETAKAFLKHVQYGYLGLMYVEPKFRGQKVNARIMESLKAWCRSQQIAELRLEVYPANAGAIKAYERTGFVGHTLEMRANLNET